jgi:hypothetical protein
MDKLAQHSDVRCSVPEVNGAAAQGKFAFLLRETCGVGTAVTPGTASRKIRREPQESAEAVVPGDTSRGHPGGLTIREGPNVADSTTRCWTATGDETERWSQGPRQQGREQECCVLLRDCQEPPDADPHVRWCGGREVNPPAYPIYAFGCSCVTLPTRLKS